LFLSIEKV